jgi:hypothetical protein
MPDDDDLSETGGQSAIDAPSLNNTNGCDIRCGAATRRKRALNKRAEESKRANILLSAT